MEFSRLFLWGFLIWFATGPVLKRKPRLAKSMQGGVFVGR